MIWSFEEKITITSLIGYNKTVDFLKKHVIWKLNMKVYANRCLLN